MKAGIITFHYACNYGAVLQAAALKRAVDKLGVEAEVIDYRPQGMPIPALRNGWGFRRRNLLKNPIEEILRLRHAPVLKCKFDRFRRENLAMSSRCSSLNEVADVVSRYDAVIAGSDQIWHLSRPSVFFMEWGEPYAGKRISYAPCCAYPDQSLERKAELSRWIRQIDFLSVRNEFSRDLIHNVSGINPEVVADPTLLVDLSDLQQPVKLSFKEYIFMYVLGPELNGWHDGVLKAIKQRVGNLPVVAVISSVTDPRPCLWADITLYEATPGQWLTLIANAAFVYTDSFHGTIFSIKSQRNFLACYAEKGRAPRLMDIAARYGIEKAVAGSAEEAVEKVRTETLDYEAVNRLIHAHAEQSKAFLRKALNVKKAVG